LQIKDFFRYLIPESDEIIVILQRFLSDLNKKAQDSLLSRFKEH
jgi:hypothetical protein